MTDLDAFLAEMMPKLKAADTALHNGDAKGRAALWSRNEPVTLFGAAVTTSGWRDVSATFDWLASRFSNCACYDYDVIAAGVGDDLAYVVGIEHTRASIAGDPPADYSLRVTTIFRREAGAWKIVHRHGDPYDASATNLVERLTSSS